MPLHEDKERGATPEGKEQLTEALQIFNNLRMPRHRRGLSLGGASY